MEMTAIAALEGVKSLLFFQRPRPRTRHPKWKLEWRLGHPKSQTAEESEHAKNDENAILPNNCSCMHFKKSKWMCPFAAGGRLKSKASGDPEKSLEIRKRGCLELPK